MSPTPPPPRMGPRATFISDPITGQQAEVRAIQPYQAQKVYRCPGCNNEIGLGVFHFVIVPLGNPRDRRHWHRGCFDQRETRRPGR